MLEVPEINQAELKRVMRVLRELDPQIVKDLRTELKSKIKPVADQVAAAVPIEAPLSGMRNNGPLAWTGVRATVGFTPSKKQGSSIVSVRINPLQGKRGLYLAELAGSRSSGVTDAGRNLIAVLNERKPMKGRGGRFAYAQFRMQRPDVVRIATTILNKTFADAERRLASGN
jgi:hypothetical protein